MQKNNILLGLGTDIIEIARIRTSYLEHGDRFLLRILSEQERAYCAKFQDPTPHLAGRFCAKEAIAKALGTGFGHLLSWQDITILNNSLGKPLVTFSSEARQRFQDPSILLSISHCELYAVATAIWTH